MMRPGQWTDTNLEQSILSQISIDVPWALVERFSTLTRLSGEEDEKIAAKYITDRLTEFGIAHAVHHPTCLISIPGPARLRTLGNDGRSYIVKTPSFSPHTDGQEIVAELVYVPGHQAGGIGELLGAQRISVTSQDLRGKVVITEGMGMSARGFDLKESGAVAAIFVNPGERIHEGITTTTWGSPDLDSLGRTPPVPILTISRPDGLELIDQAKRGQVEVSFSNVVTVDWRPIPVVVAEIRGSEVPDEFVLFHGHLDSWHVGVGDNATGDAALLEIARVFQANQAKLARSIRIAWWSGHSHGRYAGSTWYADEFALDLMENCVSHVNCDSPGCRWATVYDNVMWMAEAGELAQAAIRDVTGQESTGLRPLRAGDCSFNNIGIPIYFMLSSTMPADLLAEKGYYPVGGCGANIAWHTEDDTLEIADRDNLLRDIRVYAVALLRTLNAPLHPFDYRATVEEMRKHLSDYAAAAGERFDFDPALSELDRLGSVLSRFYEHLASNPPDNVRAARRANAVQRALGRDLISVGYSRDGRFRQDPARTSLPLPDLQPALQLAETDPDSDNARIIGITLTRGQNRLVWACRSSLRDVERFLEPEKDSLTEP
jgi:N-acetylated-alpha-linked acidic dipeptidase